MKISKNKKGQKIHTYEGMDHPYYDVYQAIPEDSWLSKTEIAKSSIVNRDIKISYQHIKKALRWLRKNDFIKHRIRELKPLRGYTVEDVMKKVTHGASKHNTGVVVYEYKSTGKVDDERFRLLTNRAWSCLDKNKKKELEEKWNKNRKLTPEQAMYIKMNPDQLSQNVLADIFNCHKSTIHKIINGESYKDLDMKKYIPMRDEIFNRIKTEHYEIIEKKYN